MRNNRREVEFRKFRRFTVAARRPGENDSWALSFERRSHFFIPVAAPLFCTIVQPFTLAMRAHSTILKRLIGDKGECDSGSQTQKLKGLNLHNYLQRRLVLIKKNTVWTATRYSETSRFFYYCKCIFRSFTPFSFFLHSVNLAELNLISSVRRIIIE